MKNEINAFFCNHILTTNVDETTNVDGKIITINNFVVVPPPRQRSSFLSLQYFIIIWRMYWMKHRLFNYPVHIKLNNVAMILIYKDYIKTN